MAGAALLAFSVAGWLGRSEGADSTQRGFVLGWLLYDMAAAVILASTGLFMGLVGVAPWPVVVFHAALAVWCVSCLRGRPRAADATTAAPARR